MTTTENTVKPTGTQRDQEIASRLAYADAIEAGFGCDEALEIAMTHLGPTRRAAVDRIYAT